jgi:hypothetical protein
MSLTFRRALYLIPGIARSSCWSTRANNVIFTAVGVRRGGAQLGALRGRELGQWTPINRAADPVSHHRIGLGPSFSVLQPKGGLAHMLAWLTPLHATRNAVHRVTHSAGD